MAGMKRGSTEGIAKRARAEQDFPKQLKSLYERLRATPLDSDARPPLMVEIGQVLRDALGSDNPQGLLGIIIAAENLAEKQIEQAYSQQFGPQFRVIKRAHGLPEGWEFVEGEQPQEYLQLEKEFEEFSNRTLAQILRLHSEPQLADLVERDRAAFDAWRNALPSLCR